MKLLQSSEELDAHTQDDTDNKTLSIALYLSYSVFCHEMTQVNMHMREDEYDVDFEYVCSRAESRTKALY